jgi:hypothetical protein
MNNDPLILGSNTNNASRSTQLTGNNPDPALEASNANGYGIVGNTSNDKDAGVAGFSNEANAGRGLYGRSDGPDGAGVEGNWFATNGGTGLGVHGVSGDKVEKDNQAWSPGAGVLGESNHGDGVAGIASVGSGNGVHGILGGPSDMNPQTSGSGVLGESNVRRGIGLSGITSGYEGIGVYGFSSDPLGAGVHGIGPSGGVMGLLSKQNADAYACGVFGAASFPSGSPPVGYAGGFFGPVFIWGNLTVVGGAKSAAVKHSDGSHRLLYCLESPESWFEDFGEAKLVKGKARVKLSRDFLAVIKKGSYHVFVTPYGPSAGLYVSKRSSDGFLVEEQGGGKSNLKFSYRIVAKRKDISAKRFARIRLPKVPEIVKNSRR